MSICSESLQIIFSSIINTNIPRTVRFQIFSSSGCGFIYGITNKYHSLISDNPNWFKINLPR